MMVCPTGASRDSGELTVRRSTTCVGSPTPACHRAAGVSLTGLSRHASVKQVRTDVCYFVVFSSHKGSEIGRRIDPSWWIH